MSNLGSDVNFWESEINRKLIVLILDINQYISMVIHWTLSKLQDSLLDLHPWATATSSELDNKWIVLAFQLEHGRVLIGLVRHFHLDIAVFLTAVVGFFSCHGEVSGSDFMLELDSTSALYFNRDLLVRINNPLRRDAVHYSFCLLFSCFMWYLNNLHAVHILLKPNNEFCVEVELRRTVVDKVVLHLFVLAVVDVAEINRTCLNTILINHKNKILN